MASAASVSESMQMSIILHGQQDFNPGHQTPLVARAPQKGVGYCKQVLLVMTVCGMEMCMTFEQIYQVLILQYLGVPLSLVSLNGIICGLSSMAIIPIIGFMTDRGSNPKRRKMISLFVGMVSFQAGIIILLVSGLLKMSLLREALHSVEAETSLSTPGVPMALDVGDEYNVSGHPAPFIDWSHTNETKTLKDSDTNKDNGLPTTAYLAICGFAFVDIGYDSTMPLSRAYILESVPMFQHVKLLVMATLVQAASGTLFSLLGVVDLSDALGQAFHVDGTSAVLIFLCTLLFIAVTGGFMSTTLTGYFLTKKATQMRLETAQVDSARRTTSELPGRRRLISYKPHILNTDSADALKSPLLHSDKPVSTYATLNKMSSSAHSLVSLDDDLKPRRVTDSHKLYRSVSVDSKPWGETRHPSHSTAVPELDESNMQDDSCVLSRESQKSNPISEAANLTTEIPAKELHPNRDDGKARMKKKLIILSASTFFTFGASISFLYYAANAVTLGIYHGDPGALQGSEGKHLYDKGLQTAALGNLSFYILFTITSIVNSRLIEFAGEKLLFVIFHLVFIIPLIAFMSTRCLEAYFVTIVMVGIFRHTVYTLPFVMVNKITQNSVIFQDAGENKTSDPGKSNLGKTMSLIGFLIPAHYIIISAIMGPVFEATGDVWVPLMYSLGCACLSVLIFCLMFFVK
ncbi:unnamed protein product [Candidula unifasciata]|uniref:Uncharacterized protein n=1 Tax=Candidula unifasciata TaxID=100452 RepID=A0A8S3YMM1_9EUPU|nr:unnamed protein product [Candidula unifasciata]